MNSADGRMEEMVVEDRRLWRVPRSFTVGASQKVHVGKERRGDIIVLACGMSGYVGGPWLVPTDDPLEEVTCGHCRKATA